MRIAAIIGALLIETARLLKRLRTNRRFRIFMRLTRNARRETSHLQIVFDRFAPSQAVTTVIAVTNRSATDYRGKGRGLNLDSFIILLRACFHARERRVRARGPTESAAATGQRHGSRASIRTRVTVVHRLARVRTPCVE